MCLQKFASQTVVRQALCLLLKGWRRSTGRLDIRSGVGNVASRCNITHSFLTRVRCRALTPSLLLYWIIYKYWMEILNLKLAKNVFVSYSSKDRAVVEPITKLLDVCGLNVFFDQNDIMPGDRWDEHIFHAIKKCDVFILMWCCHASESLWVKEEYNYALELKETVVPVKFCPEQLPHVFSRIQYLDMSQSCNHYCDQPVSYAKFHRHETSLLR